jgi:hypothetical protein
MTFRQNLEGTLNEGFTGHIRYTVALPEEVEKVRIRFSFDRWKMQDSILLRQKYRNAFLQNLSKEEVTADLVSGALEHQKSEINFSVSLDGVLLGSVHNPDLVKTALIGKNEKSRGLVPVSMHGGVLEVILHVVKVNMDRTRYQLFIEEVQ